MAGLFAGSAQYEVTASTQAAWIASSRRPSENQGSIDSLLMASRNLFGWFVPLSSAAQPYSVNQIGFDPGTQAVGSADLWPSGPRS